MAPACCWEDMKKQGVPRERFLIADTEKEFGDETIIQPIPAAHEELETDEQGYHRYVGYLIKLNGVTVYHAGDTVVYEGLADRLRKESIDLGLLPINGRDAFRNSRGIVGNMDYREAAELAKTAKHRDDDPHALRHFCRECGASGIFRGLCIRPFSRDAHPRDRPGREVYPCYGGRPSSLEIASNRFKSSCSRLLRKAGLILIFRAAAGRQNYMFTRKKARSLNRLA